LIDWLGYRSEKIEFTAVYNPRHEKSYSFWKLLRLAFSGFTSFSLFPLKIAGYLGTLITTGSSLLLVAMIIDHFFPFTYFTNISFVIVLNVLLSGITLMCLGFIALYIGSMHGEMLNRPLYVIKEKVNFE